MNTLSPESPAAHVRCRGSCRLPAALLACSLLQGDPRVQPTPLTGSPELRETLDRLNTLGSLLMLGAHPDDENTGVIAYFARGRHIRTAYLAATRGEGGQNLIGPEQGDLMGLIRTQELLEARRIDSGEQFFTRVIDFGFSKSPEETYEKWGRETLLEDMVRVIRRFRPDVLVSRFPPRTRQRRPRPAHRRRTYRRRSARGGRRSGALSRTDPPGSAALASPAPGLEHLQLQPRAGAGRSETAPTAYASRSANYDPLLGKSYVEIAGESRSMHRSQSMGTNQRKGEAQVFFAHVAGRPPRKICSTASTRAGRASKAARRSASCSRRPATNTIRRIPRPSCRCWSRPTPRSKSSMTPGSRSSATSCCTPSSWRPASGSTHRPSAGTPRRAAELPIELEAINRSDFPLRWKRTEIRGAGVRATNPDSPKRAALQPAVGKDRHRAHSRRRRLLPAVLAARAARGQVTTRSTTPS